jgi:proteasome alpha subunit
VTMPFYASPEQLMRERSELARKGIARGRSVVVLSYADGVLFVAENVSSTLHKVSEIYDRIGFAAVGRYNEFENLRTAGIRMADLRGYSNDRRDVTGRSLANAYAQGLGAIFTEQVKPYEVELCVAEVGATPDDDQLYRITFDGSIYDEPGFVVMGGQTEPITTAMQGYSMSADLSSALRTAVKALKSVGGAAGSNTNGARELGVKQLEVAVLDRRRPRRAFRRIVGAALATLIAGDKAGDKADDKGGEAKPTAEPSKPAEGEVSTEPPAEPGPDGKPTGESTGKPE